jgi:molybdopterin molybdotransferase
LGDKILIKNQKYILITVKEASEIVLNNVQDFGIEEVSLEQSINRVLKENLYAERDFPPFTRVSMDGIAIQFETFEKGQRIFLIEGLQAAGSPQKTLENKANCLEVMTGAVLPNNTDTVIRYEDVEIKNGKARINIDDVRLTQNAHQKGSDRKAGDILVKSGKIISPAEIGVAATIGKTHLKVAKTPKVVIISTGDELVEISENPLPHQIRKSNVHNLWATFLRWGIYAEKKHLNDEKEEIRKGLKDCLENFDVIVMSGGVSKGKFDFIPEILEELKVQKLFHRVRQRPGKPFWFGRSPNETIVFAFPGNPASTFMCANRYFRPWLRSSLGLESFEYQYAVLEQNFEFKPDLTYFLQVKITYQKDGRISAKPIMGKGSGDLANLADADGFMELPKGQNSFKKGDAYPVIIYR